MLLRTFMLQAACRLVDCTKSLNIAGDGRFVQEAWTVKTSAGLRDRIGRPGASFGNRLELVSPMGRGPEGTGIGQNQSLRMGRARLEAARLRASGVLGPRSGRGAPPS